MIKHSVKHALCLFTLLFFMISAAAPFSVYAEYTRPAAADVILLIDNSGSMNGRDAGRLAPETLRMFIDMLDREFSRVGVIAFTDSLRTVIPLTPIAAVEARDAVKDTVSGLYYIGYTDLGLPLLEAARMFAEDELGGGNQMVILLSDGITELDPYARGRTAQDSLRDCIDAADFFASRGIPLYTVALGQMNAVSAEFLASLSIRTNGNAYAAAANTELQPVFARIFAERTGYKLYEPDEAAFTVNSGETAEFPFTVDEPLSDMRILLMTSRRLAGVGLITPSGEPLDMDGDACEYFISERYTSITLNRPGEGEWLLTAGGAEYAAVRVSLLTNPLPEPDAVFTPEDESITGEPDAPPGTQPEQNNPPETPPEPDAPDETQPEPPVPTPEPAAPPAGNPADETAPPYHIPMAVIGWVALTITVLSAMILAGFLIMRRGGGDFSGVLSVRAVTSEGAPTPEERVILSAKRQSLGELLNEQAQNDTVKILSEILGLERTAISQGRRDRQPVLLLANGSGCEISDETTIINKRRVIWRAGVKYQFAETDAADQSKLEITFILNNKQGVLSSGKTQSG